MFDDHLPARPMPTTFPPLRVWPPLPPTLPCLGLSVFQLREERSIGEKTARLLAKKEDAVRQLTARLQELQAKATPTVVTAVAEAGSDSSTGVRQVSDDPMALGCLGLLRECVHAFMESSFVGVAMCIFLVGSCM